MLTLETWMVRTHDKEDSFLLLIFLFWDRCISGHFLDHMLWESFHKLSMWVASQYTMCRLLCCSGAEEESFVPPDNHYQSQAAHNPYGKMIVAWNMHRAILSLHKMFSPTFVLWLKVIQSIQTSSIRIIGTPFCFCTLLKMYVGKLLLIGMRVSWNC